MKHQLWYIHQDGRQYGPITERELLYLARLSKLDPDAHVWSAGLPKWRRAGDLDGLFQPPPFGKPDPALDPEVAPAALPKAHIEEPRIGVAKPATGIPMDAIPAPSPRRNSAVGSPPGRRNPGRALEAVHVGPRGSAAAAKPVALPEPDNQDHANDNVVKRSEENTRLLMERVARLEEAIEKESEDRKRLKNAIEALVDYLATVPEEERAALQPPKLTVAIAERAPVIEARQAAAEEDARRPLAPVKEEAVVFSTEPDEMAADAEVEQSPDAPARHWHGEQSLQRSFWVNGVLPSLVIVASVAIVAASSRDLGLWADIAPLIAIGITTPVLLWVGVGLLRSARRARQRTGSSVMPDLAQLWVVLIVTSWLVLPLVIRFYPALLPPPVLSLLDLRGQSPTVKKDDRVPSSRLRRNPPRPAFGTAMQGAHARFDRTA